MSRSKWRYFTDLSILYGRQYNYDPMMNKIWWGGINVDNCKSANNKNCLMAMYRAAKKKKHFIHVALKRHRIKIRINHGKRG